MILAQPPGDADVFNGGSSLSIEHVPLIGSSPYKRAPGRYFMVPVLC